MGEFDSYDRGGGAAAARGRARNGLFSPSGFRIGCARNERRERVRFNLNQRRKLESNRRKGNVCAGYEIGGGGKNAVSTAATGERGGHVSRCRANGVSSGNAPRCPDQRGRGRISANCVNTAPSAQWRNEKTILHVGIRARRPIRKRQWPCQTSEIGKIESTRQSPFVCGDSGSLRFDEKNHGHSYFSRRGDDPRRVSTRKYLFPNTFGKAPGRSRRNPTDI